MQSSLFLFLHTVVDRKKKKKKKKRASEEWEGQKGRTLLISRMGWDGTVRTTIPKERMQMLFSAYVHISREKNIGEQMQ